MFVSLKLRTVLAAVRKEHFKACEREEPLHVLQHKRVELRLRPRVTVISGDNSITRGSMPPRTSTVKLCAVSACCLLFSRPNDANTLTEE